MLPMLRLHTHTYTREKKKPSKPINIHFSVHFPTKCPDYMQISEHFKSSETIYIIRCIKSPCFSFVHDISCVCSWPGMDCASAENGLNVSNQIDLCWGKMFANNIFDKLLFGFKTTTDEEREDGDGDGKGKGSETNKKC